jgi:peptide/nickel transport system permease protein
MSTADIPVGPATPAVAPSSRSTARRETIRALLRSKSFIAGVLIVGFWILCAIGQARFLQDPNATSLDVLKPPSSAHWFGTDRLGRDVFARVIAGARDILSVAPAATVLGTVLGTALGLVMGYFRGIVDDILGRIVDAVLALPVVIVALLAVTAIGPSKATAIIVIGLVFAPLIARTVRAAVLSERELEYVSAARLRGERAPYIMFVEILPNVLQPVIVEFTVRLGYAIFTIATLTFLGFGIQPPSPDWGVQVSEEYGFLPGGFWWPTLFPALAIATLIIGINLIADALSGVFDR